MQHTDNENMEDLISFNTPQSSPNKNFIVSSIGFRSFDDLICLNSPTCNIEIQHAKLVHDNIEDQKKENSGYKEMMDLVCNNIMIEGVSENNVITNTRLQNPFDEITDCTSEIKIKIENHETTNFLTNNSPRGAFNILTDSIKNFQSIEGLDCGRESLGILKLDTVDYRSSDINWLNVPETFIKIPTETLITFKESTSDPLNTGFLESDLFRNNKMSVLSSISSYNSITTPSLFNSASLEASELSKIYSVNSPLSNKNLTESLQFNEAFLITNDVTRPNSKESESSKFELGDSFDDSVFIEARHVASKIADGSILETSCDELYSLDCTPPPQWNILDDVNDCQINVKIERDDVFKVIDKMVLPPPSFNLENNDISSKSNIVKTVNNSDNNEGVDNKNFLGSDENSKHNSNCSINKLFVSQNSETNRSVNHNESIENLSSILINDKVSITSQVSNQSRSKDVKNILHNLSEIISSENRSEEQKTEGLNLLCSLSNMLCGNETNLSRSKVSSEDSGHSSIELDHEGNKAQSLENQEYFEALDLSTKTNSSHENLQALNLSRKSTNNKRLSQSFSFPSLKMPPPPPLNLSETIQKIVKNVSVVDEKSLKNDTNGSTNSGTNISNLSSKLSSGKLKPKKVEPKITVKKGPLKAVIPVGNMSKEKAGKHLKKGSVTPTTNIKYSSMFKSKRTSTPIADSKIQLPVAQSTPEDIRRNVEKNIPSSGSTQLYKRKFEYPISPLARPNSIGDVSSNSDLNKSNRSESAPNVFNDNCSLTNSTRSSLKPVMNRRRSASDLKIDAKKIEFKRRYSVSKDQSVASSLSRVRANIVKAKNSELSSKNVVTGPKVPLNKNRSSLNESNSNIKPFNLMEKLKKATGKENAGR